jgi:hypothetical protein
MRRFRIAAAALPMAALLAMHGAWPAAAEPPQADPAPSAGGIDLQSQDAAAHLTYASIIFYKGRRLLQAGDEAGAGAIFRAVEAALHKALELASKDQDASRRALVQSQSAFMLGDIALFVRKSPEEAKTFYQQSLQYYPEHDGAVQAMGRLLMPAAQP